MRRRQYLASVPLAALVGGFAGCQSDSDTEGIVGRGTLTIENRTDGPVQANYGMLEADESLDEATLASVDLGVEGDSFEVVYTDVTGGPYRFVVTVSNRGGNPFEQQWNLDECQEYGVTARIFADTINMSGSRCVRTD